MTGRRRATLAATITGAAALVMVPTWTGAAPGTAHTAAKKKAVARNVIVLQGDGMGTAQRDLIRLVTKGNRAGRDLAMDKLDHTGLVHTDPKDPNAAVTDSAAAATAFATGVKTYNGAIGVDIEPACGRRRHHAGSPNHGAGINAAIFEIDTTRIAFRYESVCSHFDGCARESVARII